MKSQCNDINRWLFPLPPLLSSTNNRTNRKNSNIYYRLPNKILSLSLSFYPSFPSWSISFSSYLSPRYFCLCQMRDKLATIKVLENDTRIRRLDVLYAYIESIKFRTIEDLLRWNIFNIETHDHIMNRLFSFTKYFPIIKISPAHLLSFKSFGIYPAWMVYDQIFSSPMCVGIAPDATQYQTTEYCLIYKYSRCIHLKYHAYIVSIHITCILV